MGQSLAGPAQVLPTGKEEGTHGHTDTRSCAGHEWALAGRHGQVPGGAGASWEGMGARIPRWASSLQIENLQSFTEDRTKLANADQFYLLLLGIPW